MAIDFDPDHDFDLLCVITERYRAHWDDFRGLFYQHGLT